MDELINFLFSVDRAKARELMGRFELAGLPTPMRYGDADERSKTTEDSHSIDGPSRRTALMLELATSALSAAVVQFDDIVENMRIRWRRAANLKTAAAITTAVFSSAVVATLVKSPSSSWGVVLGSLTTLSSVVGIYANRLEDGKSGTTEGVGEVFAKQEAARHLLAQLQLRAQAPNLFRDTDDRIEEAGPLITYLNGHRRRLGLIA